ncbi:MAG: diguanylate cyclase, partial [bacterium]|nr:diguanylate cyclase [bacterium]
ERTEIYALLSKTRHAVEILQHNLEKTGRFNPDIEKELEKVSRTITKDSQNIRRIVETEIFHASYSMTPEKYFDIVTEAINNGYTAVNRLFLPMISSLIERRINSETRLFAILISVFLGMFFLILYFSLAMYLSTSQSIRSMSNATLDFASGNFNKRINIHPESEYKILGNSFNHMADQITGLIEAEKQDKGRIQAIIDSAIDARVQMNESGIITGWSHQAETILGWMAEEAIGQPLHQLMIPKRHRQAHIDGLNHFLKTGEGPILGKLIEIEGITRNGLEIPIELMVAKNLGEDGYEFNAFIRNITERKKSEESFRLFGQIFEYSFQGITITDSQARIIDVNPAFTDITGFEKEEVIGKNPSMLNSGKQGPEFYKSMWSKLTETGHWQGELWNRKKDGDLYAEKLTLSTVWDQQGDLMHYIGLFSDITDAKKQQDELKIMAHYDPLTRLPNRVLLSDRFQHSVAHCKRDRTMLGVCFLDLDKFKPINDSFGHRVGDQLLIQVARRIEKTIREEDTVSRLGGDEFAIILTGIKRKNECEEMIQRLIRACSTPYQIENNKFEIGISVGIALSIPDSANLDTLLREADNAMYAVKRSGRNNFQFFDTEDNLQHILKQNMLDEIRRGLSDNQFCLFYQPKVNMGTGEIIGVEALIRWIHPVKGLIPPMDFLPQVDGTELEMDIGRWVISEAIRQA